MTTPIPRTLAPPECPNCSGATRLKFAVGDRNRRTTGETFAYYECSGCRCVFLHPQPLDMREYYADDYVSLPETLDDLAARGAAQRFKLELFRPYLAGGRVLEVGPGGGEFAWLAWDAGYELEVADADAGVCDRLARLLGIRSIVAEGVAAALARDRQYDAVVLWHVFEHLRDPWGDLDAIAASLRPGGVLLVATPNPCALQFRVFRSRWTHVDAPRHLQLVPPRVLMCRAEALHFEPVLCTTSDEGARGWNRFGWAMSLQHIAPTRAAKLAARIAGETLARLLDPFERRGLLGSAYTIIFRRTTT